VELTEIKKMLSRWERGSKKSPQILPQKDKVKLPPSTAPRSTVLDGGGGAHTAQSFCWDFVLLVPLRQEGEVVPPAAAAWPLRKILKRMKLAGLEISAYIATDVKCLVVRISATPCRLLLEAEERQYKMLLDSRKVRQACERGLPEFGIKPIVLDNFPTSVSNTFNPYGGIYAPYLPSCHHLYKIRGKKQLLIQTDRIDLILSILEGARTEDLSPGCGLNIKRLVKCGALLAAFPLHDYRELNTLVNSWKQGATIWAPWNQPLNHIRAYFGERAAFYFAFLMTYTLWLVGIGAIGGLIYIFRVAHDGSDEQQAQFYVRARAGHSILMVLPWAAVFVQAWKRVATKHAFEWGTLDYASVEVDRPEFLEDPRVSRGYSSPVTGQPMNYYSARARRFQIWINYLPVGFLTVCCMTSFIYLKRVDYYLQGIRSTEGRETEGQVYISLLHFLISVEVEVMRALFRSVAEKLTELECHRTETAFQNHLVTKAFCFEFFNSYGLLLYTAFFEDPIRIHSGILVTDRIHGQLLNLFITFSVHGNMKRVFPISLILSRCREFICCTKSKSTNSKSTCSPAVQEFLLKPYSEQVVFDNYLQIAIQFGYLVMFSYIAPAMFVIAIFSNLVTIRTEAHRMSYLSRRVEPEHASGIPASWLAILNILAGLGVITNIAFVLLDDISSGVQPGAQLVDLGQFALPEYLVGLLIFFVTEHLLCLARIGIIYLGGLKSYEIQLRIDRAAFVKSKLIDHVPNALPQSNVDFTSVSAPMTVNKSYNFVARRGHCKLDSRHVPRPLNSDLGALHDDAEPAGGVCRHENSHAEEGPSAVV
jgi:anoctamin-10/anoctamin-7